MWYLLSLGGSYNHMEAFYETSRSDTHRVRDWIMREYRPHIDSELITGLLARSENGKFVETLHWVVTRCNKDQIKEVYKMVAGGRRKDYLAGLNLVRSLYSIVFVLS